ncbi:rhodanese-like domain-containing protein [Pseudomonadota bacterium]
MKPLHTRTMHKSLLLTLTVLVTLYITPWAMAQDALPELPKAKQTELGLYLTASEAYVKWQADPDNVTILDVRTTEEYIFVGHAPMARNVPLVSQTYEWDENKQYFSMKPNPDFITQLKDFANPPDTILVMCRSGGRSAMAVNLLAQAGFKNVYNITDGMEGDAVKDPASVFMGQRLVNGWKNSGLPWTYKTDTEQMRFVTNETEEEAK